MPGFGLDPGLREVLLGTVLGDTHMFRTKTGAWVRFGHGDKQKEYLQHKVSLFWEYPRGRWETYIHPKNRGVTHQVRLHSSCDFVEVADLLYRGKRKKIDAEVIDGMSGVSWAYWFMDDGTVRRDSRIKFNSSDSISIFAGSKYVSDPEALRKAMDAKFGGVQFFLARPGLYDFRFNVEASQQFGLMVNEIVGRVLPQKKITERKSSRRCACPK